MVFLSHNWYEMSGLAPYMDGCFILRATRFSNRDTCIYIKEMEEILWSVGDNMKFPSHEW